MERHCKMIIVFIVWSVSLVYAPPNGWRSEIGLTGYQTAPHFDPRIAISSTGIHVISRNKGETIRCWDAVYNRSTDTGVYWPNGICLETKPPTGHDKSVDITAAGNDVFALYELVQAVSPAWKGIKCRKSTNGGTDWNTSIKVVEDGIHPRITVDGSLLHALYAYDVGSNYEIYRKQSTDGGGNWSTAQRLTNAIRNSWHPAVSVNGNTIHLIWADNRNAVDNYEIYYDRSTNHGTSWQHESTSGYRFTDVAGESEFPDIVGYTDDNYTAVHVVWQDATTEDPGPGIYYRRSTNNGTSWGTPVLLFANGYRPSIAADERGLYVVWDKDGYIYYRESTDWGTTWQTTLKLTNTTDKDSFPDISADDWGRHIAFVRDEEKIYYMQRDIVYPDSPENLVKNPFVVPPPVALDWDDNTEPDLDKYRVYRKKAGDLYFSQIGTSTQSTYTDYLFPQLGCYYYYYVTAVDLANNESDPSNTVQVWVPNPGFRFNLGQSTASSFTVLRDGYHAWGTGSDSTADYGELLKYRFMNLDPECDYTFGFGLFEPASDSGRILAIASGTHTYQEKLAAPESLLYACYTIPESFYSQGTLNVILTGEAYEAVLSEILIWEWDKKSGGPQSNNTIDVQSFSLEVYPTLTSEQVTIHYMLPSQTDGTIEIYDCVGKLVYSVTNLQKYSGGTVFWDGNKVSAGVYFVRLKTIDANIIQKVIMVR